MKNTILFGLVVNLIFFGMIYIIIPYVLWSHIVLGSFINYLVFFAVYIVILYSIKYFITKVYKTLTDLDLPAGEKVKHELYEINNRAHWGGVFEEKVYSSENKELARIYKNSIEILGKITEKDDSTIQDIKELENKLENIPSRVTTGGSLFEAFFCLKRSLR